MIIQSQPNEQIILLIHNTIFDMMPMKPMKPMVGVGAAGGDDMEIDEETLKKDMRREARDLDRLIGDEERMAIQYNCERERINYFWIISKKELEEKKAEFSNKEREKEEIKNRHDIELQQKKQMIKHVRFQNLDQITDLKIKQEIQLKSEEDRHRVEARAIKADVRALKVQDKEQELRNEDYIKVMHKDYDRKLTSLRQEYERMANEISKMYQHKMKLLRNEMENKRKRMIEDLELHKTNLIKDIVDKNREELDQLKHFFTDVSNNSADLLKSLKQSLKESQKELEKRLKEKMDKEKEERNLTLPLEKMRALIEILKGDIEKKKTLKKKYNDVMNEIYEQEAQIKELEWHYEVRLQQLQYLEGEKKEIFDKFNNVIYEVHQKTGLKNLILEKKLETLEEAIETKDAQLNQLLQTANIDPSTLGIIRTSLEEVENYKNEAIREIQQELKRIREAHSNMVKTYEGKLAEFGIPVEELGFDPLVPANI